MVYEAAVLASVGWVAGPMIKMLIDKVLEHLGTGIKKKMKTLEATVLPRLSLAIEKAEKSPNKDKLVVDWLRRLKGAYYEAEEAIDLFEYEKLKQKVKDDRKKLEQKEKNGRGSRISLRSQFVRRPLKIAGVKLKESLSIFSRQKIMLKACIKKLIEIAEAKEIGDFLEDQENASGGYANRETSSIPLGKVFGREDDKKNIEELLMKNPANSDPGPSTKPAIPIIVITGRSGVGKTTLARYVYQHMDKHFDLLMWVHAPRKFNASDVIKKMIEIIKVRTKAPNDNPFTSLEALSIQLITMLGSKKVLLVLDDFWSATDDFVTQWGNFIRCLSNCSPGSKILLTTQSIIDGKQSNLVDVTEVETYYLREIKEDEFFKLFMHCALAENSQLQKEKFEELGRKIAVKLKGDPGAAMLVGPQLRGKPDLRHWERVAEKDWSGDNMKARIWSYQQLPQNLQCCFAICCLFPKGTRAPKKVLINFWMAQGFITPIDKHESLEDTGENYLDELVSRFFIEKVGVGKENRYQLHDLLHDLAEQVQGDDFIRIDSTNSTDISSHKSENIRHILLPSSMISKQQEKICLMKNIRTFWVKHDSGIVPINVLKEILKHLKKLRVLYLFNCVDDFPDSIGKLKHLRYLNIDGYHGYQPLKKIPDSICKLYHLQNLGLMNSESLPKDFCELISLRLFDTSRETISHISHVGRLTSLQELDYFVVRKECGYELQQLENLNQLRGKMYIAGLENVGSTEDAVKANMQNKKYLEALTFEWNSDERDTDDVAGLCTQHVKLLEALQPQPNISDLTIKGFRGDTFPNWILSKNSLKYLTSLALMCCDKIEKISSIEESLPNCKSLILQRLNNLKEMPSLPPNLTYLEINDLPQRSYFSEDDLLRKVERSHEVLPSSLTILKISLCPIAGDALSICIKSLVSLSKLELSNIRITSLPPENVLRSLKNLQSLTIAYCIRLNSLGGIGALTSLIELVLSCCLNLNTPHDSLPSTLKTLEFHYCSNVEVLLDNSDLQVLRDLSVFNTDPKKKMGVLHVGRLIRLECLSIDGWNGQLEGLNSLTVLNLLHVRNCREINLSPPSAKYAGPLPWVGVDNLLVLKLILSNETISSVESLAIFSLQGDSLDDEVLQYLTSLKHLFFSGCNITHLLKDLKNLKSLQILSLDDCQLFELEREELPKNLRELHIQKCPNLAEKLNEGGPYRVRFHKEKIIVTFPMEG